MRAILEELYLGNITPNEKAFEKGSAFGKAFAELEKEEDHLRTVLDDDGKAALEAFAAAQSEINHLTAQDAFVDGFRLGVRLILASLSDEDGALKPLC